MRAAALALALLAGCAAPPQPSIVVTSLEGLAQSQPQAGGGCILVRVVDGDTVKVRCGGREANMRLMGFDTPETYGPGCFAEKLAGTRAKIHLQRLLLAATDIRPEPHGRDKYDRILARLYLDGQDVAERMIADGHAVRYGGERRINWCARLGG